MICPDFDVISAYFDKEVGFPWNKELEEHISGCESCKRKLEEYKKLKTLLQTSQQPDYAVPMERVRKTITLITEKKKISRISLWRKSVKLPVPVVAAACIMACIGLFLMFSVMMNMGNKSEIIVIDETGHGKREFHIIGRSPEEIQALLESFEFKTSEEEAIIRLPDDSEYFLIGEPEIIKAVDYRKNSDR
jgi:hypothetical protein